MNGILMFSTILWVFIDRVKKMWTSLSWGKWITTGLALIAGLFIAFGYQLDLLLSIGLTEATSIGGKIFAGLAVAAGASCINEILAKVQGKSK